MTNSSTLKKSTGFFFSSAPSGFPHISHCYQGILRDYKNSFQNITGNSSWYFSRRHEFLLQFILRFLEKFCARILEKINTFEKVYPGSSRGIASIEFFRMGFVLEFLEYIPKIFQAFHDSFKDFPVFDSRVPSVTFQLGLLFSLVQSKQFIFKV